MESVGEWTAGLAGMYSTVEEADFMAQLLSSHDHDHHHHRHDEHQFYNHYHHDHDHNHQNGHFYTHNYHHSHNDMEGLSLTLQESSGYSGGTSGYYVAAVDNCSVDTCSYLVEETGGCNAGENSGMPLVRSESAEEISGKNVVLPKNVLEVAERHPAPERDQKKRPRVPSGNKNKRNTRTRKSLKNKEEETGEDEPENKPALSRPAGSTATCGSDEDSNGAEGSLAPSNSNGKARAGRGAATDPQSLYARKRREKINERLKVLQGLVPNGTKVDISTMLEEAVQYVKFLQLQIKVLSSDDLWMYAPIAYNGMDIGLRQSHSTSMTQ